MISQYITRKEIAAMLEVSTMTIGRNEKALGLDKCDKVFINKRMIRYDRKKAIAALKERNINAN